MSTEDNVVRPSFTRRVTEQQATFGLRDWILKQIPLSSRVDKHRRLIQQAVADAIDDIGSAEVEVLLISSLDFTRTQKDRS